MITNELSKPLASAMKAKSPIVAVPIEGYAPICLNRRRLVAALKGVNITGIARIELPEVVTVTGPKCDWSAVPHADWMKEMGGNYDVQGPELETRKCGGFVLEITGKAGSVRTRCRFAPISRTDALRKISDWAEKEAKRIRNKIALGAIGDFKKASKKILVAT